MRVAFGARCRPGRLRAGGGRRFRRGLAHVVLLAGSLCAASGRAARLLATSSLAIGPPGLPIALEIIGTVSLFVEFRICGCAQMRMLARKRALRIACGGMGTKVRKAQALKIEVTWISDELVAGTAVLVFSKLRKQCWIGWVGMCMRNLDITKLARPILGDGVRAFVAGSLAPRVASVKHHRRQDRRV